MRSWLVTPRPQAVSALCLVLMANLGCLSWVIMTKSGSEWLPEICYQHVGSKDPRWFWRWVLYTGHTALGTFIKAA